MKRVLCILLAIACVMTLASCVGDTVSSSAVSKRPSSSSGSNTSSSSSTSSVQNSEESSQASSQVTSQDQPAVKPTTMTKRTAFYSPRQAVCVYTVSIEELDADTVSMLRSLQGLIARYDSAALYLINGSTDLFWKNYASGEMGIYFQSTTVENLIARYSSLIGGVVIYTPETFEYEAAFNMATQNDCLVATEQVARRYALTSIGQMSDVRNLYKDKRDAYERILSDGGKNWEYLYLSGEGSAFADYAYATGALMLSLDIQVDWERAMLQSLLQREGWSLPAVAFVENKTDGLVTLLSTYGFGALQVSGFSNSTFLSSATTSKKYAAKQPTVNAAGTDGSVYLSFLIRSGSLGDTVNGDYSVWSTQSGVTPASYEMPLALAELAPTVMLWYSDAAVDKSRLVARGWTDIDQKAMPYDIYRKWHNINNSLMSSVGLELVTTETLREDSIYGESYGDASNASGIFVTDGSGEGSAWFSEETPVIVSVNVKSLPALDLLLSSMTAQRRAQYYLIAVSAEVFSQPYTYEAVEPDAQVRTVYLSDVLLDHTSRDDVAIRTATAENLMQSAKLYYSTFSDRP